MEDFLKNLQVVAKSPYALIGYLVLIAAWIIVVINNYRIKIIASNLKDIPEVDRIKILEKNFGIHLKEGMTADKYIAARSKTYYFYFTIILIMAILIGYLAWLQKEHSLPADSEAKTFCDSTLALLESMDNNFNGATGKKTAEDKEEIEYESKLKLPNGRFTSINFDIKEQEHYFMTSFYAGRDEEIAGKVFTKTVFLLEKCLPDWYETNSAVTKDNDQKSYVSFNDTVHKIILIVRGGAEDANDINQVTLMLTLTASELSKRKTEREKTPA